MKTRMILLLLILPGLRLSLSAQSIPLQADLRNLIQQSVDKDYRREIKDIDLKITGEQRRALKSAYLPTLEIGGKYLYAYSSMNSEMGEITGFESIQKLEELMKNPAFPLMFPGLAQMSNEIVQLQQLLAKQGIELPTVSKDLDGSLHGNYAGIDATARILLFSGGKVPNTLKAIDHKIAAQQAMQEKCITDVISEVVMYYDQIALLNQSAHVLDESSQRLEAESRYATAALKNGLATSYDTLRIAVAQSALAARKAEYESKKAILHMKLAQLTGNSPETIAQLYPVLEPLVYQGKTNDISSRAEMRAIEQGLEAQKFLLKAEKSHYLPKVQAIASARYDYLFASEASLNKPLNTQINLNRLGLGPTLVAGAGFKWELFDRSNGCSKEKIAQLEVRKAEVAKQEAKELLELNLEKCRNNYLSCLAQVSYKEKQKQSAEKALELAIISYNEGMLSISERLAAENEVQNAGFEYLQALANQRQSALECYKATGSLTLENIQK